MKKTPAFRFAAMLCYALLVFGISSCSKSDDPKPDNSGYHFTATIGGKKVVMHNAKFQGGGNDGRWEHVVVSGSETTSVTSPSLDFEIWRLGGDITPGTYVTPAETGMISRYAVQLSGGTLVYNSQHDVFTVKIDAISKDGIKGTMTGTLRSDGGESISITDGEFNLPYDVLVNP